MSRMLLMKVATTTPPPPNMRVAKRNLKGLVSLFFFESFESLRCDSLFNLNYYDSVH